MIGRRGGGYRFVRLVARGLMAVLNRVRVEGLERVPAEGGALLVANHQSMLDIPLLGTRIERRVTFVARDTLRENPLLAWIIHTCGGLTVKRGAADRGALEAMIAALERGEIVAIFPEGTRSRDGSVGPFQRGALLVAKRAGVPVLPVGLAGTGAAWPPGRALPGTGRLAMVVGEPLPAGGGGAAEQAHARVVELAERARTLTTSPRASRA